MPRKKDNFGGSFGLNLISDFTKTIKKDASLYDFKNKDDPYRFTPLDNTVSSRVRFYDYDSSWVRWRRGYELYCLTQTLFGSKATGRNSRGDFRMYCAFQQYPGVFIPARVFLFPSTDTEIGQHMVGIRDTNSFNFYEYGLPITSVRYLTTTQTGTYSQSGTTVTVILADHGYFNNDSIYFNFTSGAATDTTSTITVIDVNTFTATVSASANTAGNVTVQKVTTFADPLWTQQRVGVRFIPTFVTLTDERLADRIIERDTGLTSTYSRTNTTVTVTCPSDHGLTTGNEVLLTVTSGTAQDGLFKITVTSSMQFTVENFVSGSTNGNVKVERRLRGYNYTNYVGYTVTGVDLANNEILFQRADSYGAVTTNTKTNIVVPASRGFQVGRYLTTEIRYQCTCTDYMRRKNYNLYKNRSDAKFPSTSVEDLTEGGRIDKDGNVINTRDDVGVFSALGYVVINNFYQLPEYDDTEPYTYTNLMYYQMRWCKHIYAAMWSVVHDEGNDTINITAKYTQTGGANITINATDHGLEANTRVDIEITSGNVTSGEYVITQVIDKDNFLIIAPITATTAGYCIVRNLRNHQYVKSWLYEPNDQPAGESLTKFYERFHKEFEKTKEQAERMRMMGYGIPWKGALSTFGDGNLPTEVGDYLPDLMTMIATGSVRRSDAGSLDRDAQARNTATTTLYMFQKLLNIPINLLSDVKFGLIDKPLTEYLDAFRFAQIDCDLYRNGTPLDLNPENIECGSYINGVRTEAPIVNIDAGTFVNG